MIFFGTRNLRGRQPLPHDGVIVGYDSSTVIVTSDISFLQRCGYWSGSKYTRYVLETRAHLEPALALIHRKPPAGPIATSFLQSYVSLFANCKERKRNRPFTRLFSPSACIKCSGNEGRRGNEHRLPKWVRLQAEVICCHVTNCLPYILMTSCIFTV